MEEYLLLGGHGLGTHSVFGLALISAMRSLNLALSEDTVLNACREKEVWISHFCFSHIPRKIYVQDTLKFMVFHELGSFLGTE